MHGIQIGPLFELIFCHRFILENVGKYSHVRLMQWVGRICCQCLKLCLPLSWHMSCAYSAKQIRYETVTKANWTEMSCIVHIKHIANITNITTSLFKHSINLCERFIFHFSCTFLLVTFSLSLSHPCESHLHLTIKRT